MDRFDTVTLLSDLGNGSEQAGVVRATVHEIAPEATIIDLTHDIAPFDVRGGSLALARAAVYLNNGVIIAAVDPGAGPSRRLVGVEVAEGRGIFLGPDNGLLAPAVAIVGGAERAVILDRQDLQLISPGEVFAARDVLAPVAGALCVGADLYEVGTPVDPSTLIPGVIPIARSENGGLACEVLWVDRFGNCQLNIGPEDLEEAFGPDTDRVPVTRVPVTRVRVTFGDVTRNVPVVPGFAELGPGGVGLVHDSAGLLCLAVERGSAARELPLGEGDQVLVLPSNDVDSPIGVDPAVTTAVPAPRKRP